jgi:hypothetical protein
MVVGWSQVQDAGVLGHLRSRAFGSLTMSRRIVPLVLIVLFVSSAPLSAQRPIVGFGLGGGVILGTQLFDHSFTAPVDGQNVEFVREISLDQIGIFDAHVELYPIPHIALRGHGMWGSGDLRIQENDAPEPTYGSGRVRVSGLDAGISFWPWTPHSVGFAPFVTVGVGRLTYDFDAGDDGDLFQPTGSRSEKAFLFGIGADMNVWRSITLRIEAMNHRVPSPLEAGDFTSALSPGGDFDQHVSNVSLVIDLHLYLPFSNQ